MQSIIIYAIPFVGAAYKCHTAGLARIHKRILRKIEVKNFYDDNLDVYTDTCFLTISQMFRLDLCLYIHKNIELYGQQSRNKLLRGNEEKIPIITPHREIIRISHLYKAPFFYNGLPAEIKAEGKMDVFKRKALVFIVNNNV